MTTTIGHDTRATLAGLLDPGIVASFRRVAGAFDTGAPVDPYDVAIVKRAHAARVAVAERWSRAGASPRERLLAARVDRALNPYRLAVADDDDAEFIGEWLGELWTRGVVHRGGPPGVNLDTRAWWAWQALADSDDQLEACDRAWLVAQHRALFPPTPDRHEAAWDARDEYTWHEVARQRHEEDHDALWDMVADREEAQPVPWAHVAESLRPGPRRR